MIERMASVSTAVIKVKVAQYKKYKTYSGLFNTSEYIAPCVFVHSLNDPRTNPQCRKEHVIME